MCGVEYQLKYKWDMFKVDKMLHMFFQKTNMSNKKYKIQFDAFVIVLISYRGCNPIQPEFVKANLKAMQVT